MSNKDVGANSPAQKPLSGVLKSDNCSNYYPVAGPFLYLLFMQRALPERFEGRVGWEEEGKPSAEAQDGLSVTMTNMISGF